MSEKKRVRVYAPQVNTDHFAQYMFDVGGPVDAPGMMQPQDTSNDVVQLLQTYAQVAGLDDQQFQQMYTKIMSMEPDKQAQVISQIQQELNSSMQTNPMMAKSGGYIKSTKKLLSKKIGGVSVNKSKEGIIGIRKGTVENQIGKSFMNSMLDDSVPDYSSAMLPGKDYGGYVTGPMSGMTGYANREDNPFYTSMQQDEQNMFDAISNASQAVGQLGFRLDEDEPIKVRRTGVARNFGNNPAQVSTDVPTQRDGGGMPSYQTAGSVYVNESYAPAFEDLNIRDEDYINAKKAYESGNFTPDQLDMINRVESYVNNLKSNPAYVNASAKNQTTTNNTSTGTSTGTSGATGINGWYGGIYWQNGVPVTTAQDMMTGMQQGMGAGTDFSQIFQSGDRRSRIEGNLMDLVRNPYAMKQFGKALNQFGYPVSKVKAKVNPFGAKVKIIFDDKGNPVGEQVVGQDDGSLAGTPVQSNMANRIRSGFQSNVDEEESSGFMNKFNSAFEGMKTRRYARKYGQPDMSTMGQPAPATTTGSTSAPVPMGRTSGSGMGSVYEPDITTPNPVYAPVQVQPRQTMEDLGEFAIGGNAGKLVLKQGMDYDMGSIGRMISPLMDAGAAFLKYGNQQKRENEIYNTGRIIPSIPAGMQGSRGTDGTASLTGKQIPDLKTLFAGKATYQGIPMSPLATGFEYGGTYDLGGEYQEGDIYEDLSDEQLDDIFKRGGQVQYI